MRSTRLFAAGAAVLVVAGCTSNGRKDAPAATTPELTTVAPSPTTAAPSPTSVATSTAPSAPEWPTYHGDFARTGVSTTMPAPSGRPRVVASVRLDAAVYASPIVADGRIFMATENNSVYALDRHARQLWHVRLGAPSPGNERPCGNIDPLGITGTPVYHAGMVYVAAEYGGPPRHELVALDASSGRVRWRTSIDLPGADPRVMQQRSALTLTGGRVWVAFGGLAGDCGDYKGRVVGVRTDGSGQPIAYTVPTTREAGIWTPPGPVVAPDGNLFVAVGNGESGPGDPYDHSDSVLEIGPDATLRDSFSPTTWAQDNAGDLDLGSQGPALVGRWVFAAGKSGRGYVLRRGALGGIGGEVSSAPVCESYGGTAVHGNVVYVPCNDGVRAVHIGTSGQIRVLWQAESSITGSPVVGGGRVWALDTAAGVLHGLDPSTGRSTERIAVGPVTRFATPAVDGATLLLPAVRGLVIVAP